MDELEISGRRFLSTRRAAKDHKYTSDYVGQLIRGGKVVGKKVGRSWYVDEQSLNTYLSGAVAEPINPPVLKVREVDIEKPTVVVEEKKVEPKSVVEEVVEEKTFEPVIVKSPVLEEHHIPIRTFTAPVEKPMGGLRYVTDDEPALPEVKRKVALTTAPAISMHYAATPVEEVREEQDTQPVQQYLEHVPHKRLGAFAFVGLLLVAAAAFSATAALSVTLNSRIVVEQGQVAGVGYTFE